MPVYKIVDGYVAIVAQELVFFDVSAEGISADVTRIDIPSSST